jgi:hypothetical protein
MKTNSVLSLATLLAASFGTSAFADRGPAAPDFSGTAPARHIPRDLAASDGTAPILPLDVVAFHLDSAVLIPSAVVQVDRAAKWMLKHSNYKIVLEGHTDKIGDKPYNEDLATRRAALVRNHMIGWGVPADRIVLLIYGEADAKSPENPSDRRVVMFASDRPTKEIVAGKLDHAARSITAVWTDRGTLFQQRSNAPVVEPPHETVASRR